MDYRGRYLGQAKYFTGMSVEFRPCPIFWTVSFHSFHSRQSLSTILLRANPFTSLSKREVFALNGRSRTSEIRQPFQATFPAALLTTFRNSEVTHSLVSQWSSGGHNEISATWLIDMREVRSRTEWVLHNFRCIHSSHLCKRSQEMQDNQKETYGVRWSQSGELFHTQTVTLQSSLISNERENEPNYCRPPHSTRPNVERNTLLAWNCCQSTVGIRSINHLNELNHTLLPALQRTVQ